MINLDVKLEVVVRHLLVCSLRLFRRARFKLEQLLFLRGVERLLVLQFRVLAYTFICLIFLGRIIVKHLLFLTSHMISSSIGTCLWIAHMR